MIPSEYNSIKEPKSNPVSKILLSPLFVPAVFIVGIATRLFWLLMFHPDPQSDYAFYLQSAESIVSGHGYATSDGSATAYFPIGYPLFLAALFRIFGISVTVVQAANVILSVASLFLAYPIARHLFKSETVGRFFLLLLAIYPNNIAYTSLVAVETFYLFLMFLGVALLLPCMSNDGRTHYVRLLLAGLVFGYATLVKAQTLLLPGLLLLLFPLLALKWKSSLDRLKKIALLYVVLIAVVSPWIIRNYNLYHDFLLSNNDGLNLYMGNGPEATGRWVPIEWFANRDDTLNEHTINVIARKRALDYIRTHPGHTLSLIPKKLAALFLPGDGIMWTLRGMKGDEIKSSRDGLMLLARFDWNYELLLKIFFICSLLFGVWRRFREGKGHGWSLLGIVVVLYFVITYLVFYGEARYAIPIYPWMIMYVAALFTTPFVREESQ
ncbi:MAG: ArnT family glycosyltransferase [Bacteroidota bacterium]